MSKLDPIECPICIDDLEDPRALPCGHCYCGPPKDCLKAVGTEQGLTCSVCKRDFDLNITDLGPLFGLRDIFQPSTSKPTNTRKDFHIYCSMHPGNIVLFRCESCKEKACSKCFDSRHQSHYLISYRSYLHEMLKPLFESALPQYGDKETALNNIVRDFEGYAQFFTEQRDSVNVKKKLFLSELSKLADFEEKWKQLGQFVENVDFDIRLPLVESFLEKPFKDLLNLEEPESLEEPNFLGINLKSQVIYTCRKNEPVEPIIIKNKYYSVEILFFAHTARSFVAEAILTPTDPSINGARFNGIQSVQVKSKERIIGVKDIPFEGTIDNRALYIFEKTEIHVNKQLTRMRIKNITKRGTFTFSLSFQINIYVQG